MAETRETSGSPIREAHPVSGEGLTYTLDEEQRELEQDVGRTTAGRTAKTLAKTETLRVTLVYVRAGETVEPEAKAGEASLQVLRGRLSIQIQGGSRDVGPGQLVILSQNLRQPLRALEDTAFLLTVAWQEGAGAWVQEERSGRH